MISPLQKIRKENNVTLTVLAAKVGIDAGNLSRVERGKQKALLKLAEDICKLPEFFGEISEIEILYPERFVEKEVSEKMRCKCEAA